MKQRVSWGVASLRDEEKEKENVSVGEEIDAQHAQHARHEHEVSRSRAEPEVLRSRARGFKVPSPRF